MTTISNVLTANVLEITYGGQKVAMVQSISITEDWGLEAAYGIGEINPAENVPTRADLAFTLTKIVLKKDKLRKAGILPKDPDDALIGRVFDIVCKNKLTGEVLLTLKDCSLGGGNTSIDTNQIVRTNISGKALKIVRDGVEGGL